MPKRTRPQNSRNHPLGSEPEVRARAERGRTNAEETPLEFHSSGVRLPEAFESYARTKLGSKLGAFARQIERVHIGLRDLNGPRGGEDIECRIQVVISSRPDVVVHATAADARRAFDAAAKSTGQAVKRDLERAGFTQNLRATQRRSRAVEPQALPVPPEAEVPVAKSSGSKAAVKSPKGGGKPGRPSTRKGADSVRSDAKLSRRARDRALTPKARATRAQVKKK